MRTRREPYYLCKAEQKQVQFAPIVIIDTIHEPPLLTGSWNHSHPLEILTADLLLPSHLIVEVVKLLEEVVHLAALVVSLGGGENSGLGLLGEVLTDVWNWKHDLLHTPIMTHNLKRETDLHKIFNHKYILIG